jgi:hypothetical protein
MPKGFEFQIPGMSNEQPCRFLRALAPTPGLAAGLAAGLVLARRWRRHLAAGLVLARGWRRQPSPPASPSAWRSPCAGDTSPPAWRPHGAGAHTSPSASRSPADVLGEDNHPALSVESIDCSLLVWGLESGAQRGAA